MAEGRMIKKAISMSRKLAGLKTDSARLLYTWLLPHLDIEGRFAADPDIVKGYIVPRLKTMTPPKILIYLKDMAENNLIILYNVNGDIYLELVKFKDFQSLRSDREAPSRIPSPDSSDDTPVVLPESSPLSKVKESKDKVKKSKYGEFVFLTDDEYQKLIGKFGITADEKIAELNEGIGSKGYKYNSHYHTILSWDRKAKKTEKDKNPAPAKLFDEQSAKQREQMKGVNNG